MTWFLSELEVAARAAPRSELLWSIPTAKSDRAFNWGESAIAPDAVGKMIVDGLHIPFYFEYELRARHPKGVLARLRPYTSYYWSPAPGDDQPPFPTTLFVVDREDVEDTFVCTAARLTRMSLRSSCRAPPCCPNQGYWEGHGVPSGSLNPPDWRCPTCGPTAGTRSTTGCVL